MNIFFSGIGGSGVSAIAGFIARKGNTVFGSDRLFDRIPEHPLSRHLQAGGITIVPQDGLHIDRSFDRIVFSTAVEKSNPDFRKAEELGIPVMTRPQYLAGIVAQYKTIAVAGTSGKSTVAGMLAFLMKAMGRQPNFLGGGRVKQFRTEANPGNFLCGTSDQLIFEACESDGSLVSYRPSHSIMLNLDLDHNPVAETARMFEQLAGHTDKAVFINADDNNLSSCSFGRIVCFSLQKPADYRAEHIMLRNYDSSFTVHGVPFRVSLPGRHNISNALACISLLSELGIPLGDISDVLPQFAGIERRFDIHLDNGAYLVIDDYAHNPHKIGALMQTMQRTSPSVCYIFQPHGFGPTRLMKDGYIETFSLNLRETDQLLVLPIYYAGGTSARDISSDAIAEGVRAKVIKAAVLNERGALFEMDLRWHSYVVFGARDDTLSGFAAEIGKRLELRPKRD